MKRVKVKKMVISRAEVLQGIRRPLPKQTGGVHIPDTAYRRKREADAFRAQVKRGAFE